VGDQDSLKYGEIYDSQYRNKYPPRKVAVPSWLGWKTMLRVHEEAPGCSVLDVGCGGGAALEWLGQRGHEVMGVDPSSVAVERLKQRGLPAILGTATGLSFGDAEFDIVMHTDVFEHLHPDDVSLACRETLRVARIAVYCRICTKAARNKPTERAQELGVRNLHMTVRPLRWWIGKYGEFGFVEIAGKEELVVRPVR